MLTGVSLGDWPARMGRSIQFSILRSDKQLEQTFLG
jgi:hypothetical protein